jgi:tyrosyl-DNA phosphodiesterase-1
MDEEIKEDVRPSKRQHLPSSSTTRFNNASNSPIAGPSKTASSREDIFWDGEIRQTGNIYADPKKDSKPNFRLTDIIGDVSHFCPINVNSPVLILAKTTAISFAIISSYATDWEFAFKRFDADNVSTPVICVSQPAGDDRKPGIKYVKQNWIRTQPYLHTPFSSMHMKVGFIN